MWRDDAYLLDILVAARKIQKFTEDVTREQFDGDEIIQNAVMRMIEIIGEAARSLSQEAKEAYSWIPWKDIVAMRNKLIHQYFRVDAGKVWDTVQNDIPALMEAVEPLVPPWT